MRDEMRMVVGLFVVGTVWADTFNDRSDWNYFPMKVGLKWTYKTNAGAECEIKIVESKKVDGETWFRIVNNVPGVIPEEWEVINRRGVEGVDLVKYKLKTGCRVTEFKFPFRVGTEWSDKLEFEDSNVCHNKCKIEGRERVEVPAGTFDCLKVSCITTWGENGATKVYGTYYVARSVSLVKYENRYSENQTEPDNSIELVKFETTH